MPAKSILANRSTAIPRHFYLRGASLKDSKSGLCIDGDGKTGGHKPLTEVFLGDQLFSSGQISF